MNQNMTRPGIPDNDTPDLGIMVNDGPGLSLDDTRGKHVVMGTNGFGILIC